MPYRIAPKKSFLRKIAPTTVVSSKNYLKMKFWRKALGCILPNWKHKVAVSATALPSIMDAIHKSRSKPDVPLSSRTQD